MPAFSPKCFRPINIFGVLVFISILVGWCWWPRSPEGRFRDDYMGTSAQCYFEFQNGHVVQTIEGHGSDDLGWYAKVGGKWIWVSKNGYTNALKTTLFGIQITSDDGKWTKKFPRLFIK